MAKFEYSIRYRDLSSAAGEDERFLEIRDRELEDFLNNFSAAGQASSLRRTTNQSYNSGSAIKVNCNTTDWLSGCTADGTGGLTVVTAGVWHCTCQVFYAVAGGSDPVAVALFGGTDRIDNGNLAVAAGDPGYANLSGDFLLAAGDNIYFVVSETSGAGVSTGTITASASHPARLMAHLVG